ncbi:MAG: ABC transporter ATP-binding protein [Acutalibacter sp.]
MIEVKNLTKRYGQNLALDRVSFKIEEGTIVGFLGPNGAGKSTTMNIITGYLSATSGEVTVSGKNTLEEPGEVKKQIGYLPEQPPLYMDMTVKEYLNFMYDLKKAKLPREQHIKEICQLVKIENVYNRLIGNLSKGYKQRVGIAQALIGNPPVLILDEPTVGLDPKQIIEIRALIKNLGRNHTVILSSHILPEVQAVCERIIVINNGRVVADGATDTLAHDLSPDHRLILRAEGPEKEMVHALQNVPGVVDTYSLGEKEKGVYDLSVESTPDNDIRRDVFALMARKGWPILALKNTDLTLEDLFLQLTSSDASLLQQQESEEDEGGNQLDPDKDLDLDIDAGQDAGKASQTDKEIEKGGDAE